MAQGKVSSESDQEVRERAIAQAGTEIIGQINLALGVVEKAGPTPEDLKVVRKAKQALTLSQGRESNDFRLDYQRDAQA